MKRNYSIDLLKVIAAIFVFYVHFFNKTTLFGLSTQSLTAKISFMLYTITLSCVPIFFTIAGMNLRNRLLNRIHIEGILYFLMYALILTIIGRSLSFLIIQRMFSVSKLISYVLKPEYFLSYYFYILCIASVLNKISDNIQFKELIITIFCVTSPNIFNKLGSGHIAIHSFTLFLYPVLYYIIGVYLYNNHLYYSNKKNKLLSLVKIFSFALANVLVESIILNNELFNKSLGVYNNIFVVLITIEIIRLVMSLEIRNNVLKFILRNLSRHTLAFYIIGIYFSDSIAYKVMPIENSLSKSFILSPINLIISFSITLIISNIINYMLQYLKFSTKYIKNKILKNNY